MPFELGLALARSGPGRHNWWVLEAQAYRLQQEVPLVMILELLQGRVPAVRSRYGDIYTVGGFRSLGYAATTLSDVEEGGPPCSILVARRLRPACDSDGHSSEPPDA